VKSNLSDSMIFWGRLIKKACSSLVYLFGQFHCHLFLLFEIKSLQEDYV